MTPIVHDERILTTTDRVVNATDFVKLMQCCPISQQCPDTEANDYQEREGFDVQSSHLCHFETFKDYGHLVVAVSATVEPPIKRHHDFIASAQPSHPYRVGDEVR